jgi:hypothetical protein
VTIVSQKARYRRQASLCYEIAATLDGERVAAMVHLGDVYAGLAAEPDEPLRFAAVSLARGETRGDDGEDAPECPRCRSAMRRTGSLAPSGPLPAREMFRCRGCGEALVCKKM